MGGDGRLGLGGVEPGEGAGFDQYAGLLIGLVHAGGFQWASLGLDDDPDRDRIGGGKLEIALVVGRHRHDRAGAVFHEHEIGGIDRQSFAVERVDRSKGR